MKKNYKNWAYLGAGSPSASHSIINGLSFSFCWVTTWKSNSSVGGCLTKRGGEGTETIFTSKCQLKL